jgi:hypothetical protein
MERASDDRIRLCMSIVKEDAQHLRNVFTYLKEELNARKS